MNSVIVCVLLVIPTALSQAPQAPPPGQGQEQFVRNYCPSGDANCEAALKRCLGEPPQAPQGGAPPNVDEITAKYNNCFKANGVQEIAPKQGEDPAAVLQARLQTIIDPAIISSLKCCFGRQLGVLDANNKIDLKSYTSDIEVNYKNDRQARTAFTDAIRFCSTDAVNCEAGAFNECTFQYCIKTLNTQ